jgi:uncharacterized protein
MKAHKLLMVVTGSLILATTLWADPPDKPKEGPALRSDAATVECLLPGQVRQLGAMTYISPRRPTRTTIGDCHIRGGTIRGGDSR